MNTYLAHYGIKNQKWGTRHWQNPDGSYNEAGLERYFGPNRRKSAHAQSDDAHRRRGTAQPQTTQTRSTGSQSASKIDKTAIDNYKKKILESNPSKEVVERYKKMSDDDVRHEITRREHVKKALIAAGAAGGVGAAVYVAYRTGALENILAKMNANFAVGLHAADAARSAPKTTFEQLHSLIAKETADDVGYVLKQGDAIYRMQSFAGADVSKMSNAVFASHTKLDRSIYMTFLKDYSGTGQRYAVDLVAKQDIKIPSLREAQEIFSDLYKSDEFQNEMRKTMAEMFATQMGKPADSPIIQKTVAAALENSKFYSGIWSLGKDTKSTQMLAEAFRNKGFNAVMDYHDMGHFSNQPIIVFDPTNNLVVKGETLVDDAMRLDALKTIASNPDSVQWARAVAWLKTMGLK